ncbi:OmpA family protein [Pengzhenrongella sicca]|uniref:OmpA family protein n=1 Tax=Pengzhenrongella sicca TaxID=2819238 RepID=A0A8A4ZDA5_9MICO|nr:OmpA family protein [Pengzhenrongella sicca]QTE29960.1 OmpA family protein [Pengzhenrongella sicca]
MTFSTLVTTGRRGLALAVAAALLLGGGAAYAASGDDDGVPTGTVDVDGQETPILASFAYHQFNTDTNPELRGFVHGVRRIEGGTVLYYSVGTPADGKADELLGSMIFPVSMSPYKVLHGTDLKLIDAPNLTGYLPLSASEGLTTLTTDLAGAPGELRVGFAVFAELPAGTTSVQVVMPWGTSAGEVPVEDGALEPVGTDPAPLLGEGWPALPPAAELAGIDPTSDTYTLMRRSGDMAGTAETEESPEQVSTTLDANVLFATGSAELSGEAQSALAAVAADIASRATGEVVITGHTDSDGADASNQTLSEQRAAAVLAVLQPASGSVVTFTSVGKGESEPIAENGSAEGKQQNRRVTVVYAIKGAS